MLESTPISPVQSGDLRWPGPRFWLPAIAVTVFHFAFLTLFFAPAISMPDANAYFAQARRIATEHRTWFTAESPAQYIPPHWLKTADNRYFSKYPPGLPLIAAGVFRALGPEAALLVNPMMASLSLLALMLVCRQWLGAGWGLLAGGLMAVNPAANQQALWAFAHTAVGFFLVWGMFLMVRWASSRSAWYALVAGLCVGVIPTIRYAEAAFVLGFATFVVFQLHQDRRFWRSALVGIVGAAIPMVALAVRNHLAFGAFWHTGYAMTREQTGFGFGFLLEHAPNYLERLLSEGAGPLFGLAVIGIAILCARRETRAQGTFLAALIIPTTLLYMSYYFPADQAAMRFLVPTLFIYPIAGVWTLRLLHGFLPRAATLGAIALLAITAAWGLPLSARSLQPLKDTDSALTQVMLAIQDHVPPVSVVIADAALQQNLDYFGQWRLADISFVLGLAEPRPAPAALGPAPRQAIERPYRQLDASNRIEAFRDDVWNWAGGDRRVFFAVTAEQLDQVKERLGGSDRLREIHAIDLPVRESQMPRGFPRGGDGPRGPGPRGRPRGAGPAGGPGPPDPGALLSGDRLMVVEWTRGS